MKGVSKLWRHKFLLALFLFILIIALGIGQGLANLSHSLVDMAEARARQLATDELYNALDLVMDSSHQYSDFVTVAFDDNGRVNMLSANAMLMNAIATEAATRAQESLSALGEHGVQLPVGAAFGASVFSGSGPKVSFSIVPVGTVVTNFVTEFESAGINQTRHTISLEALATVQIVIPTGTEPISVSAKIPVAESILIGEVPESFIQVTEIGDALNFTP